MFQATSCEDFKAKCTTFARKDEDSRTTILKLLLILMRFGNSEINCLTSKLCNYTWKKIITLASTRFQAYARILFLHSSDQIFLLQPPLKHYMPLTGFNFYHRVDGNFTFSNAMAGWGYIVYDENGNLHPTNCGSFSGCKNPEEVELKALLQALTCAQKSKLINGQP